MVQALFKRLILINDRDVANLVELVESLDAVLDELSQLDGALDGVGYALDHDVVSGDGTTWSGRAWGGCEELVCSLQVAADADTTLDADLIGGKHLLGLLNTLVLFCHTVCLIFV